MNSEELSIEMIQKMAETLKVIAHPTRLSILRMLKKEGSLSVSEIQSKLACDCEQSMLSHHLIKMKDRGVLKSDKTGKFISYSLVNENICKIFDCIKGNF